MFRVQLPPFDGPLDLLLFFIQRDEVDIHDIPIGRLADEFLAVVRAAETVDLDEAAEFVHVAALLIQIKTRMLLPRPPAAEGEEPEDPRRELVERLLEYVRVKESAASLADFQVARAERFTRGAASSERERFAPEAHEVPVRATLFDLAAAYRRALERAAPAPEPTHAVGREAYALDAQRAFVLAALAAGGQSFLSLVDGRSRAFVITTFLAVLDLAQAGRVRLVFGVEPEAFGLEPATLQPAAPVPA